MINVLHLVDREDPGGAQQICIDIADGVSRDVYRSIVGAPGPGWVHAAARAHGLPVAETPIKQGSLDWGYLRRIHGLVRSEKIDVIQTHLLTPAVYGSLVGLLRGVPAVCTFHGQVDVSPTERFSNVKFGFLNRRARVVFVSEALRRHFLAVTPVASRVTQVIPNGIDAAVFTKGGRALRSHWGIGAGELLVGAVGHLRPPKAYDILLRTAALLQGDSHRFRFVVVGGFEGTERERLAAIEEQLGIRGVVQFVGYRADVAAIFDAFDIYAVTSSTEGFSLSAVQAMAAGLPVVSTRSGGPEEIVVHQETGLLVDVGRPEQVAKALQVLAADPDLRARMGLAGSSRARAKFSRGAMIRQYEHLYASVVTPAASARKQD